MADGSIEYHVKNYLNFLMIIKKYSNHTIKSYKNDLSQFIEVLEINLLSTDIASINHIIVRSWIVSLAESKLSPKSINRKISTLRSFFKYLQRNELILSNPMTKIIGPKVPKRLPRYIDKDKIVEILDDDVLVEVNYETARENIVISLLYHTGIRRSELIELLLSDIDLNQKTIKVLGKGNKERIVPLTDQIVSQLESYILIRNQHFLNSSGALIMTNSGQKAYPKLIYNIVVKILRKYNASDKPSPHVLRHTFATHLAASGAELNAIKELLGHSSLAATQIYTHNSIERLKEVYDKSHPKSKL